MQHFLHRTLRPSLLVAFLAAGLSIGSGVAVYSQSPSAPQRSAIDWRDKPIVLPAGPLRLFVVGDTGTGGTHQKKVAEAMARRAAGVAERARQAPVRAVIMAGDNFYENGVKDVNDPLWKSAFENVYDKKRLPMPFFAVLGNHDWRLNPRAQIAYAQKFPNSRWEMDSFWYRRQYFLKGDKRPLAALFFIDSNLWFRKEPWAKPLPERQLTWLRNGLASSRARWKFVIAHHPLYTNGEHGRGGEVKVMRKKLGGLLKKHKVDAHLAGHDHDLQRIAVPGQSTLFLISGAGGKLRKKAINEYGPFYASKPGFLVLSLGKTQLRGEFQDEKGRTLDSFTRRPLTK